MVLCVLPLMLALGGQAPPPQQAQPAVPVQRAAQAPRKVYNETADAKAQIAAAIKAAAEDDIRVLINFGANDDEKCAKFPQAQRDPDVAPKFSDEYKLVSVDVGHLDKNMDVAQAYGATLAAGALPHFTVLDKTGKVLAQLSGRDLAVEADPAALDAKKLAAFLARNQAPAPDAQPLVNAALAQAKREDKEVFLWFSAPW
jgi:hypothetical protein